MQKVPGQFILTGSTVVDRSKIHHSGTGRISRMKMLPMSLWESRVQYCVRMPVTSQHWQRILLS